MENARKMRDLRKVFSTVQRNDRSILDVDSNETYRASIGFLDSIASDSDGFMNQYLIHGCCKRSLQSYYLRIIRALSGRYLCRVGYRTAIGRLNTKRRSLRTDVRNPFRDEDKSLRVQRVNARCTADLAAVVAHVAARNAETTVCFVTQKRRRESSGCSRLRSGIAARVPLSLPPSLSRLLARSLGVPENFPASRRAPRGTLPQRGRPGVLSASLDSFEKPGR